MQVLFEKTRDNKYIQVWLEIGAHDLLYHNILKTTSYAKKKMYNKRSFTVCKLKRNFVT